MFWYKTWLETRWRFVIGLMLLILSACGTVLAYPRVVRLMPLVTQMQQSDAGGELGRRIREAAVLAGTYHGYVWSQWFRQNLVQLWTILAALLGTGGLLAQSSGGAVLFTLSMPASRQRVLAIRAVAGLAEALLLALIPSLLIPLLSPAIGESYSVLTAFGFAVCLFIGGTVFFSLAFFLSTVFTDLWRPLLIALAIALVVALYEQFFRETWPYGIFRLMTGEVFFRTGHLPWLGLIAAALISTSVLYLASVNIAKRDF
jgi:ABC-2 type transport system permease protein